MGSQVSVRLGGREVPLTRARLGRFLALQDLRGRLADAAKSGDTGKIAEALIAYLQAAVSGAEFSFGDYGAMPWYDLVAAFAVAADLNTLPNPEHFALLLVKREGADPPWAYPGRDIHVWVHHIAAAYHWSLEAILDLWPEQAVAFVQEIFIDRQLEREFEHSLSQVSYKFNKRGLGKLQPMKRPAWMTTKVSEAKAKTTKLRKDGLPIGAIIYPPGSEQYALHEQAKNGGNGGSGE
jgi:hypothetical protein